MMRRTLAVILATPFIAGSAQEPRRLVQADSIPIELAAALISAGGLGADPQILIGSLPGWIANRLYIPSNARVLGAAFLNTTVVGVLTVPDAPEAVMADLKRELPKLGWKPPPPSPSYGGGFRPAPFMPTSGQGETRFTLCSDQQILTASAMRHRGASTQVVLRSTPGGTYSVCNPPPMPAGMTRSPFPTLYNPPGALDPRSINECSSSVGNSTGTGTTLHGPMDGEAVLAHYAKQLQDSGWHATAQRPSVVGRSWTRVDSAGAPIDLTLTVTTSSRDSTCQEVSLQVRTPRKP